MNLRLLHITSEVTKILNESYWFQAFGNHLIYFISKNIYMQGWHISRFGGLFPGRREISGIYRFLLVFTTFHQEIPENIIFHSLVHRDCQILNIKTKVVSMVALVCTICVSVCVCVYVCVWVLFMSVIMKCWKKKYHKMLKRSQIYI